MLVAARAAAVTRGCGRRRPGCYIEAAYGPDGIPFLACLIDPPAPLPPGLDLVNKVRVWVDPRTQIPHILSWIGEMHYPFVWDIIKEVWDYGASRRISPLTPGLETLIPGRSRLLLVHPRCLNTLWKEQQPPEECLKHVHLHDLASLERERIDPLLESERRAGPCLFQTKNLIPASAAKEVLVEESDGMLPVCMRTNGSSSYQYIPTGETGTGLTPGIFAALPISGFALVKDARGTVHQGFKLKLEQARLPFYETEA